MTRFAVDHQETARRNLGNTIRFYREQRRFTQHKVADICSTSVRMVDAWERGDEIPPDWQWAKLINVMHRDLREYRALRMRAQAEQSAELPEKTHQSDAAPLTQSLADKLDEANARDDVNEQSDSDVDDVDDVESEPKTPVVTPPAAATPAPIVPLRVVATPARVKPIVSTREQREEFVRNVLRGRPDAKLGGADGIDAMLRRTYGRGMTYELFYRIRDDVRAECRAPHLYEHTPAPAPAVMSAVVKPVVITPAIATAAPSAPSSRVSDPRQEIAAVLQLLRETVPQLASLIVTTDANGELRCKYKLREIKIIENESELTI